MSDVGLPTYERAGVTVHDARRWYPDKTGGRVVFREIDDPGLVDGIALHHDAVSYDPPSGEQAVMAAEKARISAWYGWHTKHYHNPNANPDGSDGWNWPSFGYHLAAFPSGRVYLLGQLNTTRAHVAHRNTRLRGIVAPGDFTRQRMETGQVLSYALAILYVWEWRGALTSVKGHRRWAVPGWETTCPGDNVDRRIDSMILRAVRAIVESREEVSPEVKLRQALTSAWDSFDFEGLHKQLHYVGVGT